MAIYRHSTPVVRRHVLIRDDVGDLDEGRYDNHDDGNIDEDPNLSRIMLFGTWKYILELVLKVKRQA